LRPTQEKLRAMSSKIQITIEDPIYMQCNKESVPLLKPCLSFESVYYRSGQYSKKRHTYQKSLIDKKGNTYTGLLPTIQAFCQTKQYELEIIQSDLAKQIEGEVQPASDYHLDGITLRPDQEKMIETALRQRRGVLVASPGWGKTVLMMSVMKAFSGKSVLILTPGISIQKQTVEELHKFGFTGVSAVGDGIKDFYTDIVVSTLQTAIKLDWEKFGHLFDVVLVDETHRMGESDATLQKILLQIPAPIRLGLSATPPRNGEKKLIMESILGPIIDEVTWAEQEEIGILSEPILRLIPVPKSGRESELHTYKDIYRELIVHNKLRNRIIVAEAKKLAVQGKTSLIFVVEIAHGQNIFDIATNSGLNCVYINGSTESMDRSIVKRKLENKELDCAVVTTIFAEGVNIKSLDAVILGHGGKSDVSVLQRVGRSLRRTEGKDTAYIYDFIDSGKYLAQHFAERMKIYCELNLI
jgi:superfamily II DNA or RNA helicase